MKKILLDQLRKLSTAHFKIDDGKSSDFSIPFSEVVFYKKGGNNIIPEKRENNNIRVTFENYIVNPYNGFTFHDTWNNGVPPPCLKMYGTIEKQTKGMYYFDLKSMDGNESWVGWIPKKSCKIEGIS